MINFYIDSKGKDPDKYSPLLRKYHKYLWSKPLPNNKLFYLRDDKKGVYLYHKSELGEFFLGSDAISNSYKIHKQKQWIVKQVPNQVNELFNIGSYIGAYIIFPNNKIDNKPTINQMRGLIHTIDDRFDLTLECIRCFYLGQKTPLYPTLLRYKKFFYLFENFSNYVDFFLLQDLVQNNKIKFFLNFNGFKNTYFSDINDYLIYKKNLSKFIKARNKRINNYINNFNFLKI